MHGRINENLQTLEEVKIGINYLNMTRVSSEKFESIDIHSIIQIFFEITRTGALA